MKNRLIIYALIGFGALFYSCGSAPEKVNSEKSGNTTFLPKALGESSEMTVIVDTSLWRSDIKKVLKPVLGVPYKGINQDEPIFTMHAIPPGAFNNIFKKTFNILYVITLDNDSHSGKVLRGMVSDELIKKAVSDPSEWIIVKDNQFAKGQKSIFLVAKDLKTLKGRIKEDGHKLKAYFEAHLASTLEKEIIKFGLNRGLMGWQRRKGGYEMTMPKYFKRAFDSANFTWYRQINPDMDENIFVYKFPYSSESIFERDTLLALREKITKQFLVDPEDKDFYITTQEEFPMKTQTVSRKGEYAVSFYGLWKSSDETQGGPYRGYIFLDPQKENAYYLEAWIYAPGKSKLKPMRKLETVMKSFEFVK